MNKKFKRQDSLKNFYFKFKQSNLYYGGMILIVLLGVLFFPTAEVYDVFPAGSFIAGPYITLALMFFTFVLYKKLLIYLFVIGIFILSVLISFIAVAMGSTNGYQVLFFFLPILILFVINICVALFTYKYK